MSQWDPAQVGQIDIRIDGAGRWYYLGGLITRQRMVALFSTILRFDPTQGYSLVTPQQRLLIQVDDVPFVIQLLTIEGEGRQQRLQFTDNTGNCFCAAGDHPLWMAQRNPAATEREEIVPYVLVRDKLAAVLSRPVYYQLAELLTENNGLQGVWSDGCFFKMSNQVSAPPWLRD